MTLPPSSDSSPFTQENYEAYVKKQAEIEKKEHEIDTTVAILAYFFQDNDVKLIKALSDILNQDSVSLDKRHKISCALGEIYQEIEVMNDAAARTNIKQVIVDAVFDSKSPLYQALNHQSNWIPVTFLGAKRAICFNYAKSLQVAHVAAEADGYEPKINL